MMARGIAPVLTAGNAVVVKAPEVETGQSVLHAAAQRVIPTVMELGGKSAAIVFDGANPTPCRTRCGGGSS